MTIPVGIDIGNEKCVVAFVNRKGVVDVLLNEVSSRETPLLIHFDEKQRLFGSAGASYSSKNPKATISQLKRLIGRRFREPSFQRERALLPYETSEGEKGEVVVNVNYLNREWKFTAVELMGMFLSHLKKEAERKLESEISECVIGVPSYLTNGQRRDYLLAAEIARLKPLRLFHDGTATALDYGFCRKLPYGEATYVVFVDIGHSDTQVTVVKFMFGTLTVLAHSFDRDLGGRDFDNVIFEHLVEICQGKHHIDVRCNPKASLRLRRACEKAKRALSVNTEAPIECLVDDVDVEEMITRQEFEIKSSGLLDRVVRVCKRALGDTDLLKEEIHSVELVGSGSRIPKISQILEDFFRRKMSRTINGSECVVNGCGFQCAMLCPALTARTFGVHDIFPFSVALATDEKSSFTSSIQFDKGELLLNRKLLILRASKIVTIGYANLKELPIDVSERISYYEIDSISEGSKCYLEVRIQIDLHGIVNILSASVIEESDGMDFQYYTNSLSVEDTVGGSTAKTECELPPTMLTVKDISAATAEDRQCGSTRQTVNISEILASQNVLETAQDLETYLAQKDRANEQAKTRRNELEACLFQTRNEVSGSSLRFLSQRSKKGMLRELEDVEEWLYGDGADVSEEVYNEKMKHLASARKKLLTEHSMVVDAATEKKNDLLDYANNINYLIEGRRLHGLARSDARKIFDKLGEIKKICLEDDIRSGEYYRMKKEELELLFVAFKAPQKDKEAQTLTSRLTQVVDSILWKPSSSPEPAMAGNPSPEDEPRHGLYNETQNCGANTCDSDEQLIYGDGRGQCPLIGGQRNASGYKAGPNHKGQRQSKGQLQLGESGCCRDSYDGSRHLQKVSRQNNASGYGVDSQFSWVGQEQKGKSCYGGVPHNRSECPTGRGGQGSAPVLGGDPCGRGRGREARQHTSLHHYSRVTQQDKVRKQYYVQPPLEEAGDRGQGKQHMPSAHSPCGMGEPQTEKKPPYMIEKKVPDREESAGPYMIETQDMLDISRSSQSSNKETSASKLEKSSSKESKKQDGGISDF